MCQRFVFFLLLPVLIQSGLFKCPGMVVASVFLVRLQRQLSVMSPPSVGYLLPLKGLCKLLLSFGQRLNSRLHYSFGDKDNKELPHIAFPLVTSVDSLVSCHRFSFLKKTRMSSQ